MAKVYLCRFTDKLTGKFFFKFGHTSKNDVLDRFDIKYDPRYGEFEIKAICSIRGDLKTCQMIEEMFKALNPKNIWLEEHLGDGRKWDGLSGITEIVQLTEQKYNEVRNAFYAVKKIQDKYAV